MERKRDKNGRFVSGEVRDMYPGIKPKFKKGDTVRYHGIRKVIEGIQLTFTGSICYYLAKKRGLVLESELRTI